MSTFRKNGKPYKKIADPLQTANPRRTERLTLALTPTEKENIATAAKTTGMSRTDYIINSIKGTRVVILTGLPEVLLLLSMQCSSLNQIARALSQRGHMSRETIEKTCQSCQHAYDQLVRFVDQWDVKAKKMEETNYANS